MSLFGHSEDTSKRSMTALGHGLNVLIELSNSEINDSIISLAATIQSRFAEKVMKRDFPIDHLKEVLIESHPMNSKFSVEEKQFMITDGLRELTNPISSNSAKKEICIHLVMFHLADPNKTPDQFGVMAHMCGVMLDEFTREKMTPLLSKADQYLRKLGIPVHV